MWRWCDTDGDWMEIYVLRPYWHQFGIKRKVDVALMENG